MYLNLSSLISNVFINISYLLGDTREIKFIWICTIKIYL